jgi:hypothetical protein
VKRSTFAGAMTIVLAYSSDASAADTTGNELRTGHDLLEAAPTALVMDGMWSVYAQYATMLTDRTWDAPYPWGSIGHWSTSILYGTSWTLMVGLESLAAVAAAGGNMEWLGEASYRTDWMIGVDAPSCAHPGAAGGCGMGVGDFAFIQVRPRGSNWWFDVGGGWIQQRIANDEFRTVAESSWVLTPISASYEVARTDRDQPVALKALGGPGIYFGLHNGEMHETLRGQREKDLHAVWHHMYPLDGGIGPGMRVEAQLVLGQRVGIEGEVVMAPFLLGGPVSGKPSSDIAPLDFEREGWSVWRKGTVGLSWNDRHWPLKPVLGAFAAELSERPMWLAGHRGVILRFDIPLRVPGND